MSIVAGLGIEDFALGRALLPARRSHSAGASLPRWCAIAFLLLGAADTGRWRVERAASPAIASEIWESHPAIDPWTGDLWFVRSGTHFEGWRLWMAACRNRRLSIAVPAPQSAPGLEADPYFSRDGRSLYYISTRRTGSLRSEDLDIWRVDRDAKGRWSEPRALPPPINSPQAEWFPRPAPDGWIYFGSRRPDGLGRTDIWRARSDALGRWRAENLGPAVNTDRDEYEFEISPNGKLAILATDTGLYILHRGGSGWRNKQRLDASINADGSEIGPLFVGSYGQFLFSRDLKGRMSGELLLASEHGVRRHNEPVLGACAKTIAAETAPAEVGNPAVAASRDGSAGE